MFTIADAERAGLAGKGTWKAYPAAMLRARATTSVIRSAAPDVVLGLGYSAEEVGGDDMVEPEPVVLHQTPAVVEPPKLDAGQVLELLDGITTLPELRELWQDTVVADLLGVEVSGFTVEQHLKAKAQDLAAAAPLGGDGPADE